MQRAAMWGGGAHQHASVLLSRFRGQHLEWHTAEGTGLDAHLSQAALGTPSF